MKIVAVGDIGLHGTAAELTRTAPERLLHGTRRLLQTADIVFGNLEMPFAPAGSAPPGKPEVQEAARLLKEWGFTHVSLANNHAMDEGPEGLIATMEALRSHGIIPFGAGAGETEAERPVLIDGDPPLALIAYSMPCKSSAIGARTGCSRFDIHKATRAVRDLRDRGRTVIAVLHLGRMYLRRPSPAHRQAATAVLDAGASLVVCHHAHVPAGMLEKDGRFAAMGLGDFVFDAYAGEIRTIVGRRSRRFGVLIRAEIDAGGTIRADREVLALPDVGGPERAQNPTPVLRRWKAWDKELRLPDGPYAALYYTFEFPRLLVYVGHAAFIYACRGNWRNVYDYTLGLLVKRLTRGRRARRTA